jgi:threonine synthase
MRSCQPAFSAPGLCPDCDRALLGAAVSAGDLAIAPNVQTISPAMDIQFAYNVERMLYFVSGGDTRVTRQYMTAAQERRPERLPPPLLQAVQSVFLSAAVDDAATCDTMAQVYQTTRYTLDPHSAIGVHAAGLPAVRNALTPADAAIVCVLTAHPAKFGSACERAGVPVPNHPNVDQLRGKPHRFQWLRSPPPPASSGPRKLAAWAAAIKAAVERTAQARAARAAGGRDHVRSRL